MVIERRTLVTPSRPLIVTIILLAFLGSRLIFAAQH
jgi:hypothetical protein